MIIKKLMRSSGACHQLFILHIIASGNNFLHSDRFLMCFEEIEPCSANSKPSSAETEKCLELLVRSFEMPGRNSEIRKQNFDKPNPSSEMTYPNFDEFYPPG